MVIAWIFLIVGIILAILGLGFAIRFFSYMAGGVGMSWLAFFQLVILGGLGIGLGLFLILYNIPLLHG